MSTPIQVLRHRQQQLSRAVHRLSVRRAKLKKLLNNPLMQDPAREIATREIVRLDRVLEAQSALLTAAETELSAVIMPKAA